MADKDKKLLWSADLNNFLKQIDSYRSTVPPAVINHFLKKGGVDPSSDTRITSIVSLAVDKFLAETVNEAKQYARMREDKEKQAEKGNHDRDRLSDKKRKLDSSTILELVIEQNNFSKATD